MKRKEIITELANKAGSTKNDAGIFLKALEEVLFEGLAEGKKIRLTDVGILSVIEVPEKNAVNPQTGEPIVVPAHGKVKFKVAKALKLKVK